MLVVGGGGGGGSIGGYGGGAGAVIHKTDEILKAGTYVITIGAGGAAGAGNGVGANGMPTLLVLTNLTEQTSTTIVEAPAGGGGGVWSSAGRDGACGGGKGGMGMRGLGCGGSASAGAQVSAGGGGGILSPGTTGTGTQAGPAGNGGRGVYLDITGESDFWGWGGGGQTWSGGAANSGEGDPMGYGHGAPLPSGLYGYGRRNHGCGGGGASGGGCGVVLLRYSTPAETVVGAPVIYTAEQPRIGSTSLTLSGALDSLGGAASVSVRLLYGTSPDALTGSVDLGTKTAAGTVTGKITGLSRYTDYWYCFEASGAATARSEVRRVKTLGLPTVEQTGYAKIYTNGVYEVTVWTNTTESGTFKLREPGLVDILLVGGGGKGAGSDTTQHAGGGGGGGGFVYKTDYTLETGVTYRVTVGPGRTGSITETDATSFLSKMDGEDVVEETLQAVGGGNGGGTGASGGGGHGTSGGGGKISPWIQGYPGDGSGAAGCEHGGGGGGGAGEAGHPDDEFRSGNGGDGVPCDITGEEVWYAGGGAGGSMSSKSILPGYGGKGGGADAPESGVGLPGVDGLGGGGSGGSYHYKDGGRGGNGIVIIRRRIADADDPTPQGVASTNEVGAAFVEFSGAVQDPGGLGLYTGADVWVSVVPVGSSAVWTKTVEAVEANEDFAFVVTGLDPGTGYDWSVKLANEAAESVVASGSLMTVAKPDGADEKPMISLVSAVANGDAHSITLDWEIPWAGTGACLADVYLTWGPSSDPSANEEKIATGVIGAAAFTLDGLAPGTEYSLALTARNDLDALSETTEPVLVATRGSMPRANLIMTSGTDSSADLKWKVRSRGDVASKVTVDFDWGTDPTFATCATERVLDGSESAVPLTGMKTVSNLAVGTTYYFRLRVANDLDFVARTQAISYTPRTFAVVDAQGHTTYSPATPADMSYFNTVEAVLYPGDQINLPGLNEGQSHYDAYETDIATIAGGVLTANEPGAFYLKSCDVYTETEVDEVVTNSVNGRWLLIVPRAADAPGGVWVRRVGGSFTWDAAANWTCISGDGDYPNAAGAWAFLDMPSAGTITLPSTGVTLGHFVFVPGANGSRITGGPLTFSDPDGAWLMPFSTSVGAYEQPTVPNQSTKDRSMLWLQPGVTTVSWLTSGGIDYGGMTILPLMFLENGTLGLPADASETFTIRRGKVTTSAGWIQVCGDITGGCRFIMDAATTFAPEGKWTGVYDRSFSGVFDIRRGTVNYQSGTFTNAQAVVLSGAYEVGGTYATATSVNTGDAYDKTVNWNDAWPQDLELNGGKLLVSANGRKSVTTPDQVHFGTVSVTNAVFGTFGVQQGGQGIAVTVTNFVVAPFASVRYRFASRSAKATDEQYQNAMTFVNAPTTAIDLRNGTEILPNFASGSSVNSNGQYSDGDNCTGRVIRDKATGVVTLQASTANAQTAINSSTTCGHIQGGRDVSGVTTVSVTDATLFSLSDSYGNFLYEFGQPEQTLTLIGGWLNLSYAYSFARPEHANSAASMIDFGTGAGYIYQPSRTEKVSPKNASIWVTAELPIGCKLKSEKGLVKSLNGAIALCADSSETLKGTLAVNGGALRLGFVTNNLEGVSTLYPAKVGCDTLQVAAGGRLELDCEQPFSTKADIRLFDREEDYGLTGVIALDWAEETKCRKFYVNGVAQPRGTYGATGSGAQFIDDVHFTGPGILSVWSDDRRIGFILLLR